MREVLDIIDGVNIMEFNTPPRSSNGDLLKLEIMIWIFDICED